MLRILPSCASAALRARLAPRRCGPHGHIMDLDVLLLHYFGTDAPEALDEETLAAGVDRLALDFGVERSPERRFALWVLLDGFGAAPLPADAFEDPAQRDAANRYLDAVWKAGRN
jgi:hypothetical protein